MHVSVCVERWTHVYEHACAKQDNYEHMMEKFYGPMFWYDAHHSGETPKFLGTYRGVRELHASSSRAVRDS